MGITRSKVLFSHSVLKHVSVHRFCIVCFWLKKLCQGLRLVGSSFVPNMCRGRPPTVRQAAHRSHEDYVNIDDEEWRIRKEKRMNTIATYQKRWPLGYGIASLLQDEGEVIELTRLATVKKKRKKESNGCVLLWPSAENRNVSKRMWEMQASAARHCLEGNAMLYFKFWALCAQPRSRAYLRFWT